MALTILVCRVYLGKANGIELLDYVTNNAIDWQLFERIITAHQIRPLIYKTLSAHPSGIDPLFLEKLRKICFRIAKGNLQKLEELVRLNKLFSEHGVKNVPYKGVILSQFLFGDYISRETADIDFLTDAVYFSKAYDILAADGYKPRYYNPDFERQFLRTSHELLFSKTTPSGTMQVEIHWAATNQMMHIPLPNGHIFQNLDTINLLGRDTPILNLENHFLVLLVHHGVNDIWRTLRHSLDVSLFLEKYSSAIDWDTFREATSKYKIRHTTAAGFLVSHQLFGTSIPKPFIPDAGNADKLLQNLLRFPAIKKRKLNLENLRQQLFLRDSFTDKLRLLASYIQTGVSPNVRDMEAYPVSKKWYALYYFIKPYRILFNRHRQ